MADPHHPRQPAVPGWRFLRCREISRAASLDLDRQLAPGQRLLFHLHLVICANCRRFNRQLRLIHFILRRGAEHLPQGNPALSKERKNAIRLLLQKEKDFRKKL